MMCGINSAKASTVGFSFSSMFTIKCVGASLRIFSMLTSLVPPILGISASCCSGCIQNPVRPTSEDVKPNSHNNSVNEGTRETIRQSSVPSSQRATGT